jgi:hypothetical protein
MVCSNVEDKEYELILKYKPRYNKETGYAFRGKSPEMHKMDKEYAEKGIAELIVELNEKKEVEDIVAVFKRRL